jgi:hypothetical protein
LLQTVGVKIMKQLMVVIIALLVPAAAMAKGECKADREKFCKDAAHVGACLDQHQAELSEACKAKRERKANAKKNTEGSAKMGKEEGTPAQPGAQPLTKEDCKKAGQKWNYQRNVCE